MMEYKVGDEILKKAVITGSREDESKLLVRTTRNSFLVEKNDVIPAPDMSAEEAWEIVKRLFLNKCDGIENAFSDKELEEIFGTRDLAEIVNNNTPKQAKAKIEAWEQEKKIRVGDEVISKKETYRSGERGLVVCINSVSQIGVNYPGNEFVWYGKDAIKKTGRHIDFDKILEQIGESDA